MGMMVQEFKENCIVKGCNKPRYKDKLFCEFHWKERRKKETYKRWI